jgi:WhiB family redox-sensing transcriptional regulator
MTHNDTYLPWVDDALCAQTGMEMFFPDHGESARPAKKVCVVCPVKTACLEFALKDSTLAGIWGGTTAADRRAIRRKRVTA